MNLLGVYRWKEGCRQTEGLVQQIQQIETALLSSMYLVGTAEDSQDKLVGQPLSAGMVHVRGSPSCRVPHCVRYRLAACGLHIHGKKWPNGLKVRLKIELFPDPAVFGTGRSVGARDAVSRSQEEEKEREEKGQGPGRRRRI
jgi:hypothetical protein